MLDSAGFAELVARRPVLYHRVWGATEEIISTILAHGLEHPGRSNYVGYWESRPGHVYMAPYAYARRLKPDFTEEKPWVLLAIDTVQLERLRINPDEDAFSNYDSGSANFSINATADGKHVCCHFHIQPPPSSNLWEWANYLGTPLPTLGQWADCVGLGDDPRCTLYATRRWRGSLAYRGVIPQRALRICEADGICGDWSVSP